MLDIGLYLTYCLYNELLQTFRARKKQTTNMPFFYRFVAQFGSSGQYRCEAVNDAGFDRMEMSLQVFGKMCYLRHHSTENYCKTLCVCWSPSSYCTNTGAKAAEGASEMLCSSIRLCLCEWFGCIPLTWQCCHSVPPGTDWPANLPVSAWSSATTSLTNCMVTSLVWEVIIPLANEKILPC